MSISCKVIQDLLPLYIDGVTSAESSALVEEHLAQCEECRSLKEQMADKFIEQKEEPNNFKAKNPFRKLKRATRRTVIISIVTTFIICIGLAAMIAYTTAGYKGIGSNILMLDYHDIINQEQYERDLRELISAKEMWNADEIEFISRAYEFSDDRQNNKAIFVRTLIYNSKEYFCAVFADEISVGRFKITGYEFATYDSGTHMWLFSQGGSSELPK